MPTTCGNCGLEFATDTNCPRCGALTPAAESTAPNDDRSPEEQLEPLEQLRAMVLAQKAEIAALSERLDALESSKGIWPGRPPGEQPEVEVPIPVSRRTTSRQPAVPPRAQPDPQSSAGGPASERGAQEVYPVVRYLEPRLAQTGSGAVESAAPAVAGTHETGPLTEALADRRWEWLLGGNWLARVGVVALVLGVAFFISLAIDRGWLGETERVIMGVLFGLALVGAGEFYRARYGVWAQTVAGGGLAILYLSIWGGFALYELFGPLVAFGLFILITAAGVLQSLRHDSVGLAVLAILGGFATPLLLQERLPDERLLLTYVLLLDIGVLALASFRNWRWFTLLAWLGSVVLIGFWLADSEPSIGLAQSGVSAVFVIFAGATVAFHLVRRQAVGFVDLILLNGNALVYLLISYAVMYEAHRPWMGGFTALLALFFALLLAASRLRTGTPPILPPFAAALVVGFAALAVPIQLEGAWITIAWGVEALALVWLSFALRMRELRWFGALLFVVSGIWLLALDTPDALRDDLSLFVNMPMLAYTAAVVLPALAAWLLHRNGAVLETRERLAVPAFAVAAALFATVAIPVQLDGVWLSMAWGIEAVALVWLSFPLRVRELRWFGYPVFAVSAVWLLAVVTPDLLNEDVTPFLNLTMLGYGAAIVLPALTAWILHLRRKALAFQEDPVVHVFPVWAALFAVIAIPVQVSGVWVSVAWAGEAVILLALSSYLRLEPLRWFTYLLLATMLVRLAAFDTANLDLETFRPVINWRFLPFVTAVASLYTAAWLVRRSSSDFSHSWSITDSWATSEARAAPIMLLAMATLTTLWILSAEILASADSALFNLSRSASDNVSILGLTLLWGVYGAGLMLAGVLRRWRWVRVAGLALLIVAVVKLFAYDSQELEQVYRVIAFLALGLILVAGGLLYQRYSHAVRGFLFDENE